MLWYNCYGWWTLVSWYLRVVMTLFTFGTWGSNSSYILLSNSSYIHLSNSSYIHLSNSSYIHLCNSSYIHLCNSSYIHLPENGNFVLDAYNTDSLISITTGGTFTLRDQCLHFSYSSAFQSSLQSLIKAFPSIIQWLLCCISNKD